MNIVNFSRPLPVPLNGGCVGSSTTRWMAPARGDDSGVVENEDNVDEEMEMEVRLCVDGCGSLE